MAFAGPSKGVKNDINVTPLVDVVLVLLIIFMVVMPMLQRDEKVKLPKAHSSDESKDSDSLLIISLPADHTIYLNNKPITLDGLAPALTADLKKDPERKLMIKGDQALRVKDVTGVLAAANTAGAKNVSLAVDEAKP